MKALILAAGEGKKFYPFSYFRPKPMFPVCNKPIIEHIIDKLKQVEIKDIGIVVGHRKGRIVNYFGDGNSFNCHIRYIDQSESLGTADAVARAEQFIAKDGFLVIYGDVLFGEKLLPQLLDKFKSLNTLGIVALKQVSDTHKYISVKIENERILNYIWKPRSAHSLSNNVLAGIFLFSSDMTKYIRRTSGIIQEVANGVIPPQEYDLADVIPLMAKENKPLQGFVTDDWWIDINKPWEVIKANNLIFKEMAKKLKESETANSSRVDKNAKIRGKISIRKDSVIMKNVSIDGPVWIGKNTIILEGTRINGPAIIGDDCLIGPYCEGKGCIGNKVRIGNFATFGPVILNRSMIGGHSEVSGIVGERCDIADGTRTGTTRFDDETPRVEIQGFLKNAEGFSGLLMGDYSRTGVGAMIMPGRIIGPGSIVGPGVILSKNIPPFKAVLAEQNQKVIDWNPAVYDK